MKELVSIRDLDCIFLTYDEPKKEEFWVLIKNMIPWARRVDGVKGSDAAHKAAADASRTERFILIDGDNIPDQDFFSQQLNLDEYLRKCVFRWRARNYINALVYGNGGISCWTKEFVHNMRTHENSDGRPETQVEFCFDPHYLAMHNVYSTTHVNGSPFQAWRAGFREGVKMTLDRGRRLGLEEFQSLSGHTNLDVLSIWHNIGADVENGRWAMLGARMGTFKTLLEPDWDYTDVQNFDRLQDIWEKVSATNYQQRVELWRHISDQMRERLNLPLIEMSAEQSAYFKKYYQRFHRNKHIMSR